MYITLACHCASTVRVDVARACFTIEQYFLRGKVDQVSLAEAIRFQTNLCSARLPSLVLFASCRVAAGQ